MSKAQSRSWFEIRALDKGAAEIVIYDEIGMFGVTAKDFRDALRALGDVKEIALHINSPGGEVADGFSIYNMLRRHPAHIVASIDGLAASMASVVAMAANKINMPDNAMMMIHDPVGLSVGDSKDMRKFATALDSMRDGMARAYVDKAATTLAPTLTLDEVKVMMAEETWLTAEEAVQVGLADSVEAPVRAAAVFDVSKFRNSPAAIGQVQEGDMPKTPEQIAAEAAAKVVADKAAADAALAAAPKVETPEQIVARIRTEEAERTKQVRALCALAGVKQASTDKFITDGKTLAEVTAALETERVAAAKAGPKADEAEVVTSHLAATQAAGSGVIDAQAIWAKWNAPKKRAVA